MAVVEETAFLVAVQFDAGGIEVEPDLGGRLRDRLQEDGYHQRIHCVFPAGDHLVTIRAASANSRRIEGLDYPRFICEQVRNGVAPPPLIIVPPSMAAPARRE